MGRTLRSIWAHWAEACLAVFGLCLAISDGTATSPALYWVINLLPFISAAFAAVYVRQSAWFTALMTGLMLFAPARDVGVGSLAPLLHVFAMVRLGVRNAYWWSAIWVTFVVIITFRIADPPSAVADSLVVLWLSSLAIGGAVARRNRDERIALTKELARQRMTSYRLELARDLHDTVAQSLSHAAMRANVLSLTPDIKPEIRDELEQIALDCNNSASDLRTMLASLRSPETNQPSGSAAGLETLIADVAHEQDRLRRAGFTPEVVVDLRNVTPARAAILSKITHEAVNNMLRHAPPNSEVSIVLREEKDQLVAEFINPDTGKKKTKGRLGLVGMRERSHQLDGTFNMDRSDGKWRVTATLPQPSALRSPGLDSS